MRSVHFRALAALTLAATIAATFAATGPANAELSPWESFTFGNPGDIPLVAPWLFDEGTGSGVGVDQIGVYRPSTQTFYKRECGDLSHPDVCTVVSRRLGNAGDIPIAGSWDGLDAGIGVYRPSTSTFYLQDPVTGNVTATRYGDPGDVPIVGDWYGDGVTRLGVYRPSNQRFYQDVGYSYFFGNSGDRPIIGDWTGSFVDDIGVVRPNSGSPNGPIYMRVNSGQTVQCLYAGSQTVLFGRWQGGSQGVLDGTAYFDPATARWELYNAFIGPSGNTLC